MSKIEVGMRVMFRVGCAGCEDIVKGDVREVVGDGWIRASVDGSSFEVPVPMARVLRFGFVDNAAVSS